MADRRAARSVRSRWTRRVVGGVVALLVTLATPVPALARTGVARTAVVPPVTVPALSNWTPEQGSYSLGPESRIVARDPAARRVAGTLADDLRAAGHGTVPVVRQGAHAGDIVIGVDPSLSRLGTEGYELRAGKGLLVTAAAETGAFYGTRTLLQLLARSDRVPAGSTVDVPQYKERGVGVCACYVHISTAWLENLVRDMAYHKLNQ
ncbi:glycoside hydrolase family 20 zincin-like fold domain-containing protein, partial [Streptomyces mirabilis]